MVFLPSLPTGGALSQLDLCTGSFLCLLISLEAAQMSFTLRSLPGLPPNNYPFLLDPITFVDNIYIALMLADNFSVYESLISL